MRTLSLPPPAQPARNTAKPTTQTLSLFTFLSPISKFFRTVYRVGDFAGLPTREISVIRAARKGISGDPAGQSHLFLQSLGGGRAGPFKIRLQYISLKLRKECIEHFLPVAEVRGPQLCEGVCEIESVHGGRQILTNQVSGSLRSRIGLPRQRRHGHRSAADWHLSDGRTPAPPVRPHPMLRQTYRNCRVSGFVLVDLEDYH